jgi:enoyl-CoA hydratase
MDDSLPLLYAKDGPVATVTFNRPQTRNALTPEMLCRLADALIDIESDPALRVAIVTGAGDKAFCAGGDLATTIPLLSGTRSATDEWDRRLLDDPVVAAASSLREYRLSKPLVAAVNGACFAAGAEFLLATDIRFAAPHASFAWPETSRGVIPFAGSMVRLPRQLSYCQAMALMLTGDAIGAEEARRIGLINQIVDSDRLMTTALSIALRIAGNAPLAVQHVKRTVQDAIGRSLLDGFRLEDASKRDVMSTEDAKEGPRAFLEKRPPRFVGK